MGHWQNIQPSVFLIALHTVVGGEDVVDEVAVREHHTLCIASGTGSVYQGCEVVSARLGGPSVAGERLIVALDDLEGVDVDDQNELVYAFLAELGHAALGNEDSLRFGMVEDIAHLSCGGIRQNRDGNPAEGSGAEECYRPVRLAVGQDGNTVAGTYAVTGQGLRQTVTSPFEFTVSIAAFSTRIGGLLVIDKD